MKKLLFVYNPYSGQGLIKNHLSDIVDIMVKAGFEVTVYPTQSKADAETKIAENASGYDRIVCSGGDGTLDEVVTGLMRASLKIPVGYIPAGSTNDFGNSLGIDKQMLNAARVAAGDNIFPCDVGRFNDDYFVYVAAFGLFTEVSYTTSQELKNAIGHVAYILEGAKQLVDIPSYRMQVEHDGKVKYDEFIYGMVTNSTYVGGVEGITGTDVSLNDELFEVTLVKMPKNPIELSEIIGFFANFNKDTEMVYSFHTRDIKFTSSEKVPWTLDGEFGGKCDVVEIENLHNAMEILVE